MNSIQSDLSKLYPLGDKSLVPVGVDEERYSLRFLADSRRLFASQEEHLEVMRVLSESGGGISAANIVGLIKFDSTTNLLGSITDLVPCTQANSCLTSCVCTILRFRSSLWLKETCRSTQLEWSPMEGLSKAGEWGQPPEFCYNLRYVELNGRGEGVPWSLRQCGVYQQVCLKTQRSSWILLHISARMRAILDQALGSKTYTNAHRGVDAMFPHMIFLSAMAGNWQDYIEYLRSELAVFDEKACFSSVDHRSSHDYSVTFLDSQNLQLFQQKLLRTSTVLDSCLDVVNGCEAHCRKLIVSKVTDIGEHCLNEITIYTKQIQYHHRELRRIIQYSSGTSKLLFTILGYRDSKILQESNHAIKGNLDMLQCITSQIQHEDKRLAVIAQQTQKESQRVKVLSTIATVYLPASLIATIFSSSLLQSQANDINDPAKGSHIVISSQFWIFVVTSICLAVVTLAYPLLWDRRGSRISP